MWVAITFVAIALTGTAFMVWFLIALLREGAPSVCYWVVPARCEPEKKGHLVGLSCIYADETTARVAESDRGDCYSEILENEGHAKEYASGLIALDVRPASAGLGWRSIQPQRAAIFHQRRVWFG